MAARALTRMRRNPMSSSASRTAAEMKAAGLLDLSLTVGIEVPDPSRSDSDEEDPIEDGDAPEFAQDFVSGD